MPVCDRSSLIKRAVSPQAQEGKPFATLAFAKMGPPIRNRIDRLATGVDFKETDRLPSRIEGIVRTMPDVSGGDLGITRRWPAASVSLR